MSLFPPDLLARAAALLSDCRQKSLTITTAESCTGGLLAALLTEIPGSSDVFARGYITYANSAKTEMLGVASTLIATHGAVSEEVARAMAEGALRAASADVAIAATGIAGPGGGSTEKPVGLVHLAVATKSSTYHQRYVFMGDRSAVRMGALAAGLAMVVQSSN
ncbi:MAG: CinA family protein [Alphaproteobacteria bacterium]